MTFKKLDDIAEIFSGVQISRFIDESSDKFPLIKNKFVNDYVLDYSLEHISKDINEKYFSKREDIIISLSQPNTVSLLKKEGYIIPMYFAIIRLKEGYNPDYVYHFLDSIVFHKKLHILLEGGALKIIKVADLKNIEIYIPELEKQEEYGEFLDLIDKKNRLLENKKQCYKKFKEYFVKTQLNGE